MYITFTLIIKICHFFQSTIYIHTRARVHRRTHDDKNKKETTKTKEMKENKLIQKKNKKQTKQKITKHTNKQKVYISQSKVLYSFIIIA